LVAGAGVALVNGKMDNEGPGELSAGIQASRAGASERSRPMRNRFVIAALLILILTSSAGGSEPLRYEITPYFWFFGLKGDVVAEGDTAQLNARINDIFDFLNFAGMAHVGVYKGRLGVFTDLFYADLEDETVDDEVKVSGRVKLFFGEYGISYLLGRTELTGGSTITARRGERAILYEVFAGGRYVRTDNKVRRDPGEESGQTRSANIPIVGGRLGFTTSKFAAILVRGDIGGFGIGTDFMWNVSFGFDTISSETVRFSFRYRIMSFDNIEGSGSERGGFDGTVQGPGVGLTFRF
jgi:hypothetical protein